MRSSLIPAAAAVLTLATLSTALPAPEAAVAAPLLPRQLRSSGEPTILSDTSRFVDPARWSQASYCDASVGDSINDANVLWVRGDGGDIPRQFLAYHQNSNTIVLATQGTDPTQWESIENDLQFAPVEPNEKLARCVPGNSLIHQGFQETFDHTADDVLAQVRAAKAVYPSARVLVTGHSLGAAVANLNAAWLRCNGIDTEAILFGKPRVGNYAFASAVPVQHLNNHRDPVHHLPPFSAPFYSHGGGEFWQNPSNGNTVYACPGAENENCSWSIKFYDYNPLDHLGVFAGVRINGKLGC